MQVINRIDHLISELNELKPTLSEDSFDSEKRFENLLTAILETDYTIKNQEMEATLPNNEKFENGIPSWVDLDYGYDPKNPRKPNMRELMEAISEKDLEDLYAETDKTWQQISRQASQILYGVIGPNEDTRDWQSIMISNDILTEARKQTGAMYKPKVDIQSNFDDAGILVEQIAVVKGNDGNILRSLSNNINFAKETLINFGATKDSIPANIEEQIDPEVFDNDLLAFLKNFDNNLTSVQQIIIQSASEVIANKLSQEIPPDELAKL